MATPLTIRSTNDWLYDYSLSSAYKSQWVYDPDFALSRDPDIWEVARRDAVLFGECDRRSRNIVREWHVEPPKKSRAEGDRILADIVAEAFEQIENFDEALYQQAEASLLGRTYHYIEGDVFSIALGGTPEMDWWLPTKLKHVDRRRFHWAPVRTNGPDGEKLSTQLEFFSITRQMWEPLTPEQASCFVRYTWYDTEDRLGYGRGLLEALYFYHYLKSTTMVKVQQGLDRWANGIVIADIDSLRAASPSKTNEDLKRGALTLLQNMRSEHVMVKQKGDTIEVVETSGTGHEMGMGVLRYLDEAMARTLNGSILPSGHGSAEGSNAKAQEEAKTSESFYQYERKRQAEVNSRQLVSQFIRMNRLNIAQLGLAVAKAPKFHLEQKRMENVTEALDVRQKIRDMGLPLVKQDIYHAANVPMPGPDDDQLEGREAPLAGSMFNAPGVEMPPNRPPSEEHKDGKEPEVRDGSQQPKPPSKPAEALA